MCIRIGVKSLCDRIFFNAFHTHTHTHTYNIWPVVRLVLQQYVYDVNCGGKTRETADCAAVYIRIILCRVRRRVVIIYRKVAVVGGIINIIFLYRGTREERE